MELIEEVCAELRSLLEEAVQRNLTEGILLSGGLDTSVLAKVASKFVRLKAFTCAFQGAPAPDVKHAQLMAKELMWKHYIHYFDEDEMYKAIPNVIKALKLFDPMEVRNSITIHIAVKLAKDNGVNSVITGDALDELFAGYGWLSRLKKEELDLELQKIWCNMSFSSIPTGKALGVEVKIPYLEPKFKAYAMKLDSKYKIRSEKGQIWGKWIIRKAFEGALPKEITWRAKHPIEVGSGTTTLPDFFNKKIPDPEFEDKKKTYLEKDGVTLRDKEQLVYYETYRSIIGVPHPINAEGRTCPQCNSNAPEKATFCRICGAHPI